MNKKQLIVAWVISIIFLSGCATVNFSSKYYNPPANYKDEVKTIWEKNINRLSEIPLKHTYKMVICSDNERETPLKGIPQVKRAVGNVIPYNKVFLPDYFIRYVYEFYHNDREAIISCVIAHEIAHIEFNLADTPPETHYINDLQAWGMLNFYSPYNINDFYSMLIVIDNYWRARKGLGGHLFNLGWNTLNVISIAYGGSGSIGDLYAIDTATRIKLFRKNHPNIKFVFTRSKYSDREDKAFSSNIPSINRIPNQDNWQEFAFKKMMDTRIRVKPEIYGRVTTDTDKNTPPGALYWFKSKDGKKYYFSTEKETAKLLLDETKK